MSEWAVWGWRVVALVIYATLGLLAFDLVWRLAKISFKRLALYGGALWSSGLAGILAFLLY